MMNRTTAPNSPHQNFILDRQRRSRGLVLLVVLGMLGLFSLLGVTYVVFSGQSKAASVIINRAKLQQPMRVNFAADIIPLIVRGSHSRHSAFAGHSLLGDVYGRECIQGYVRGTGATNNGPSTIPEGIVIVGRQNIGAAGGTDLPSDTSFCKIPLDHYNNLTISHKGSADWELSPIDDSYNGRIFTMVEGPLQGFSFRVLKYIGNEQGALNTGTTPPYFNTSTDPLCYSILVDLAELPSDIILAGTHNHGSGNYEFEGTIGEWIGDSPNSLFYQADGRGYKFVINDAVFNGSGYGYNPGTDPSNPPTGTDLEPIGGNLTQYWRGNYSDRGQDFLNGTTAAENIRNQTLLAPGITGNIPIGLLPNYDYMNLGAIYGSTNEAYDVADYRDYFLSNTNPSSRVDGALNQLINSNEVIPSYHRPELVAYIYNKFVNAGASTSNATHVVQLIKLLDFACARPLPVTVVTGTSRTSHEFGRVPNTNFVVGNVPHLEIDTGSWPGPDSDSDGTPDKVEELEVLLTALISGPFDIDNDGDGVYESVWIDPDLPVLTAQDGKQYKVMTAVHIQDLDSRINVNLAGDVTQALAGHRLQSNVGDGMIRRFSTNVTGANTDQIYFTQGNGVGPAELGLQHLLRNPATDAARLNFVIELMRQRNGSDGQATVNYTQSGVPGKAYDRETSSGNDFYSTYFDNGVSERNYHWFGAGTAPRNGYPLWLRGRNGTVLDVFGNIASYSPQLANSAGTFHDLDDLSDDAYELTQEVSPQDNIFSLEELERVLRRFDGDVAQLSGRLENIARMDTGYNLALEVNRVMTTRSNELRNVPLSAAVRDFENDSSSPSIQSFGSVFEWLAALHEHHYRRATSVTESTDNDPSMVKGLSLPSATNNPPFPLSSKFGSFNPSVVRALFPIEFRHGLRFNINRPFGNSFDDDSTMDLDGDGDMDSMVVDDPGELYTQFQRQPYGFGNVTNSPYSPSPFGYYSSLGYRYVTGANAVVSYPWDGQPRYRDPANPQPPTPTAQTNATYPSTASNVNQDSRQMFARQLYCLAQLIVPQDYKFSTMSDLTFAADSKQWYKRRARTLAQWAINVVDFRDPDAIMTRFDFDYLPFGMRASAGSMNHASGSAIVPPAGMMNFAKDPGWEPEAGDVVWGMEYPEMLLTEVAAMHDKRVRVTTQHDDSSNPGALPTQFRIPQGSMFVEMVSTRTSAPSDSQTVPAVPKELYSLVTNGSGSGPAEWIALDLDKLAPAAPSPVGVQPVWRIGVIDGKDASNNDIGTAGNPYQHFDFNINQNDSGNRLPSTLSAFSLQQTNQLASPSRVYSSGLLSDLSEWNSVSAPVRQTIFDRVIWFTHQAPTSVDSPALATKEIPNLRYGNANVDNKVFYNRRTDTSVNATHPGGSFLPIGQYMVLAPRVETIIGSQRSSNGDNTDRPNYEPSPQLLRATQTAIQHQLLDGVTVANSTLTTGNILNAVVQISQAEPPDPAWQSPVGNFTAPLSPNEGIGLNVSEPLPVTGSYYPMPTKQLNTDPGSGYDTRKPDAYHDMAAGEKLSRTILDDTLTSSPIRTLTPVAKTEQNFRTLYLQRLANPLQAYDAEWNPYITIDAMTVDLTIFTGENRDQNYLANSTPAMTFESRFKDGRSMDGDRAPTQFETAVPPVNVTARNRIKSYFSASTASPVQTPRNSGYNTYFECELGVTTTGMDSSATLGYLNIGHSDGTNYDGFGLPFNDAASGAIGIPNPTQTIMTGLYWANRQFANPSELMLVPFTEPGKLSSFYTSAYANIGATDGASGGTYRDYTYSNALENAFDNSTGLLSAPFGHLMNFFDANKLELNSSTQIAPYTPPGTNLVNTPRRENYWMKPTAAVDRSDLSLLLDLVETPPRYSETATILDPGATTPDLNAFNSHVSGNTDLDLIRNRMLVDFRSPNNLRQTYTNPGKPNVNTIASPHVWASIEANATTSNDHRNMTANPQSWQKVVNLRRGYSVSSPFFGAPNIDPAFPSQFAGCWRNQFIGNIAPDPNLRAVNSTAATWRRSDDINQSNPTNARPALLSTNLTGANPEQHATAIEQVASPLVMHQRMNRLSNLVTNQSNVFAIWITVGLFEYDPVSGLGKEYVGIDGKSERQRSFYIVDRTIPVAYREGETFNAEKTILLRRNIAR
jgi:hypothetical protein